MSFKFVDHVDQQTINLLYNEFSPVFVLSSGRCGTKFMTELLSCSKQVSAHHEPLPKMEYFINQVFHSEEMVEQKKIINITRMELILDAFIKNKFYLETSHATTFFAPAIADLFKKAKFIHIVRHPGDFTRSAMRKGWYENDTIWESGRIKMADLELWQSLTTIEKICWLWKTTNTFIDHFKQSLDDDSRIKMFHIEDVVSDVATAQELIKFIGVTDLDEKTITGRLESKVNELVINDDEPENMRKRANFPPYKEWQREDIDTLTKHCFTLATQYHYELPPPTITIREDTEDSQQYSETKLSANANTTADDNVESKNSFVNRSGRPSDSIPLITVVTVVYNNVKNIEQTIQSVATQTYPNIEYLVIDGESTDGTLNVIKKYDTSITSWISESDAGLYDAMNKAISKATGEWIIFMNSGDRFYCQETISEVFSCSPKECSFIYGHHVWENNKISCNVETRPLEIMWQKISFSHQALFSKTVLMKQHPFSVHYNIVSDYEFYFAHYTKGYKFYNSDKIIATVQAGGISDHRLWNRTIERWKVVRKYQGGRKVDLFYSLFILKIILLPYLREKAFFYKQKISSKLHKQENPQNPKHLTSSIHKQQDGAPVTVIIPNYNNDYYLKQCLESVLAQTYKNLKILIIDDYSIDHSISILKRYQKKHANLQVIFNPQNVGLVAQNRHVAILQAETDYITTIDSDDFYFSPHKIEKEMEVIQYHKKVYGKDVVAFSDVMLFNEHGKPLNKMSANNPICEGSLKQKIFTRQCMIPTHFTYHKNIYQRAGSYDCTIPIYEDWDLKIRIAHHFGYYYSGIIGSGYNLHGQGLSNSPSTLHGKWLRFVLKKNISLVEKDLQPETRAQVAIHIERIESRN